MPPGELYNASGIRTAKLTEGVLTGYLLDGGYVVALAVSPGKDYHWYRQEADGSWSHKPGRGPAMQNEVYITDNGNIVVSQNMITDPEKAAKAAGYTVFIGYFYVREKKEGTK